MANKWAIQNGNWSDGSTWNDGVVPTADDDVYCNGFTIAVAGGYDISFANLYNKENPNTGISGGYVQLSGHSYTISGDIHSYGMPVIRDNYVGGNSKMIVGNLDAESSEVFGTNSGSSSNSVWTINGNITGAVGFNIVRKFSNSYMAYTINGNLISYGLPINTDNLIVNGVWEQRVSISIVYNYTINGILRIVNNSILQAKQKIDINGMIEYDTNFFPFINFMYPTLCINIINPETFKCVDISEPKTNPWTVVTNADLNNRQQYPQESDVKNGVEYAYGLKEGNYSPNFPQEANVLKDVEYDDGNKVGTLEVIALSGATATADNISVVNLTEQDVNRVKNCATVSNVQKCFEDFKE